jgi:hypothetical protein
LKWAVNKGASPSAGLFPKYKEVTSAVMAVLKNTHALMAETEQVSETSNFSSTPVCRCQSCGSQHIVSILAKRKLAKLAISCFGFACNKLGSSKGIVYIRISQNILVPDR